MESSCALCRLTCARKHKLLNENACNEERTVLKGLVQSVPRGPSCSCLAMLHDSKAVLCVHCQKQLLKIKKLEEEKNSVMSEVNMKISSLHQCK